jgi:pimeloyl-ACP methyl ester carboxylesterase
MKKKWPVAIPILLITVYLLGPAPVKPLYRTEMPVVPSRADSLVEYINRGEAIHRLKPDNEARIVWANDSIKEKTEYAIVYLHGFSASQAEGDPVHRDIARKFGCNLYLSRLAEHGIDTADQLINLTADEYWESAKEALAIGKQLGKKVILMGTSTGGTNAIQLAALYPDDVYSMIMMSPNIAINDPNAWLLNNHWGVQIAHLVLGSDFVQSKDNRPIYKQYWYWRYRVEGAAALEEMLESTMNKETFQKVKQPVDMLYFYKNEKLQDSVVKVSAMLTMFDQLGTPDSLKKKQAMPDAGTHVIGSYIKSHDVDGVERQIEEFMKVVLKMKEAGSH